MTMEYRECQVVENITPERQLTDWLRAGWEFVGLHRKQRRGKSVVVAILRRETQTQQAQFQLA